MSVDGLPPLKSLPAPAGAFERMYRDGRRRRTRKLVAVLTTAIVFIAGGVTAAVALTRGQTGADTITPAVTPTPSARALAYADRLPHYLPPGVTLASTANDPATIYGGAVFQAAYNIAGAANLAVHNYQHRDVQITLTIFDNAATHCGKQAPVLKHNGRVIRSLPPCATSTWIYPFVPIPDGIPQVIHDRPAHVSLANNGYGTEVIEWHEGTVHYLITCDRGITDHGVQGVPFPELITMAQSIPIDPAAPEQIPTPLPNATFNPSVLDGLLVRDQRTWATEDSTKTVGVDVQYSAHGNQPAVDIFILPDAADARGFITGYPVGRPTSTLTVRGRYRAQEYAGLGTIAVAMSWRDQNCTVLLTGSAGATDAELQIIANNLKITSP